MKKKLLYILILLTVSLVFKPKISHAQTDLSQDIAGKSGYSVSGVTSATLSETVGRIIKIVLGFLGTLFLVLIVYAGVLWLTAAGNEEKVTKAVSILKTSVIGLIIIIAAYSITYFVVANLFRITS